MNAERIASILIEPHASEKAALLAEGSNQYTFKVLRDSNKKEIKQSVEEMFNVKVSSVRVVSCVGKTKRRGRQIGRTKAWKKAYVRLAAGHNIELTGAEVA